METGKRLGHSSRSGDEIPSRYRRIVASRRSGGNQAIGTKDICAGTRALLGGIIDRESDIKSGGWFGIELAPKGEILGVKCAIGIVAIMLVDRSGEANRAVVAHSKVKSAFDTESVIIAVGTGDIAARFARNWLGRDHVDGAAGCVTSV